jgi:arylsulfatase A-like enzyme
MRVLFIDCDSLRPDHLGCYGYHRNTSPNIDSIAEEGRRCTNYYASDAPCGPSRAALFSSRFGIHTGIVNHGGSNADMRPEGPNRGFGTRGRYASFPQQLSGDGHHTALISPFPTRHGAWHVLDGFDEWHDTGGNGGERAEVVAPVATDWLEEHASDEDWYCHINFWDPHTHYDTPMEYGDPFAEEPAPEWPDEETIREHYESYGPHSAQDLHHSYLTGADVPDLERTPDEIASREDFVRWINGYDTGIRYMDDHIGQLLDVLREQGVYEDTLIVVSADHGENQGECNVYGDHQTADEITCNVPFVVSGPGIEPGVDDEFHYQVDFGPTVAELAGANVPDGWDGESFAASLTEGEDIGRDSVVVSQGAWACQRAVRWEDYICIRTYHDGLKDFDPVEVYDLAEDPHETNNLARERPDLAREGVQRIEDWVAARMRESAQKEAGGNPEAVDGLVDPLWQVVEEGGPHHTNGNVESYAERLRETGREAVADDVEARQGVLEQSVTEYLEG